MRVWGQLPPTLLKRWSSRFLRNRRENWWYRLGKTIKSRLIFKLNSVYFLSSFTCDSGQNRPILGLRFYVFFAYNKTKFRIFSRKHASYHPELWCESLSWNLQFVFFNKCNKTDLPLNSFLVKTNNFGNFSFADVISRASLSNMARAATTTYYNNN